MEGRYVVLRSVGEGKVHAYLVCELRVCSRAHTSLAVSLYAKLASRRLALANHYLHAFRFAPPTLPNYLTPPRRRLGNAGKQASINARQGGTIPGKVVCVCSVHYVVEFCTKGTTEMV
jgi:hypothetical protein